MRSLPSSFPYSSSLLNRWRVGFKHDTVTEERASVKSRRGPHSLLTESRTSISCQVGTRCLVDLSAARTCVMAFSCSSIRWIILCLDPHHVADSVTSLCGGRPSSTWASLSVRCFFQLCEKTLTIFLQTPTALSILVSLMLLSAKKQQNYLFIFMYLIMQ